MPNLSPGLLPKPSIQAWFNLLHILENSRTKDIYIDKLNGYNNHLHAIISLGGKQSISGVMQLIKGESSYLVEPTYGR